jgi:hypothetical protein
MVAIITNLEVKPSGIWKTGISNLYGRAIAQATNRTTEVVLKAARKDYMHKRKTEKLPSLIFDSFNYQTKILNKANATGIVFAGGPSAPYAIYVDQPRKGFPGYFFMKAGMEAGASEVKKILADEIGKVSGIKVL